ncbi:MAG: FkbM family methyltransferase [Gammaproteobacteria bacterium]|nr:FkbM family methyltransferase [Gammaproteobacteria bacterium]
MSGCGARNCPRGFGSTNSESAAPTARSNSTRRAARRRPTFRRWRYRRTASGEVIKAPVLRLATIAHRLGHERIALMKMDIEGGEYAVIEDMAAADVPVNQLLVEFHHSYATIPLSRTVAAVRQLERVGFACFHLSERTYEMSFIAADPAPFSARATPAA